MHKWAILRPIRPDGRPVDQLPAHLVARARRDVPDSFQNLLSREFVVASCQLRQVLILARGCEIDKKRNQAIVAPVTAIRDLPEVERQPERLERIRSWGNMHKFYLPEAVGIGESFADLLKITAIHRDLLPDEEVVERLVVRLSPAACSQLQVFLSEYFGKSFGFDRWNECPQDGFYSCSSCFYNGREVRKLFHREGARFGPCPICGDDAEYVRLP